MKMFKLKCESFSEILIRLNEKNKECKQSKKIY